MELNGNEKTILLKGARNSIGAYLKLNPESVVDLIEYPNLRINAGAFVTLRINNELRGCIGYIISKFSLFHTVCEAAKQAAFKDPRFFPLDKDEFDKINIEISVLTPPQPITSYEEIEIGKHGLILEEKGTRALLLPQVAVENNYNTEQFLTALCEKGRIRSDIWKEKMLKLNVFEAIIFSEEFKREESYEKH